MTANAQELAEIRTRHSMVTEDDFAQRYVGELAHQDRATLLDRQAGEIAEMRAIAAEAVEGMDFAIGALMPTSINHAIEKHAAIKERLNRTGDK